MKLMIFFKLVSLLVEALNWTIATFIEFLILVENKRIKKPVILLD
jgi:hypothetical protein